MFSVALCEIKFGVWRGGVKTKMIRRGVGLCALCVFVFFLCVLCGKSFLQFRGFAEFLIEVLK